MNARQIAKQIAEELFVDGSGQKADRLALMQGQSPDREHYLGGWSKSAATSVIERVLTQTRTKKQKIEDSLRQSDLTAQCAGRTDIEYGHHETLPRGEHVANRR
jgi:hypothetical protein